MKGSTKTKLKDIVLKIKQYLKSYDLDKPLQFQTVAQYNIPHDECIIDDVKLQLSYYYNSIHPDYSGFMGILFVKSDHDPNKWVVKNNNINDKSYQGAKKKLIELYKSYDLKRYISSFNTQERHFNEVYGGKTFYIATVEDFVNGRAETSKIKFSNQSRYKVDYHLVTQWLLKEHLNVISIKREFINNNIMLRDLLYIMGCIIPDWLSKRIQSYN